MRLTSAAADPCAYPGAPAGEGEGFCDGGRFPLAAGDVVVFPPRSLHGIDVGPAGRLYALVRACTPAPWRTGDERLHPTTQPNAVTSEPDFVKELPKNTLTVKRCR